VAAITITGTIKDASGNGVQNVVIRLSPAPESVGASEAIGGIGILNDPIEITTGVDGTFTVAAIQGFRYSLEIPGISYSRQFIAPAQATIRFDLLGLSPLVESAPQAIDFDGSRNSYLVVRVESVESVRQRYNSVVVEKAAALAGPYSQLTTIDLHSGKTFYEFTAEGATEGTYYRAKYKDTVSNDESLYGESTATEDFEEESLLISVDELKAIYLFGVDLTKDDGEAFPKRMFEHYIQAGSDWLAKELDITLVAKDYVNEVQDHYASDWGRWGYSQLWNYPVSRIDSIRFQYPSMDKAVTINSKWITLPDGGAHGIVQIVPGQGNIADVLLIPGALMPLWSGSTGRIPGIWHFDYRAGFEPNAVPPDIKHVIGMWAAIGALNIAGDLIAGAGIATKSVSIPGLSQNIGTTSSATSSGYGARVLEYQKEIKAMLPNLRRFYGKNTRMVVV
jgi:hypothetical protein